jgi:type IV pilus assembly protein PilE
MKKAGFTLIELLITLAIIVILAAIAYPNYLGYLDKGYRTQAEQTLLTISKNMEAYYNVHHEYTGLAIGNVLPLNTSTAHYTYDITSLTAQHYQLMAIPNDAKRNDECGTLSINDLGEKSISGMGNVLECWG